MTSSTATSSSVPTPPLRQDAGVIGLVGLAHMISHFSQLLLAPLFPWLKDEFNASYTELGFLMTLFFVVSCSVQAASGFLVDRMGPRPILFGGLALVGLAAFGFAMSPNYWAMAACSILAGIGNGVFHPVDYTLLNRKVSARRLGHAYSFHGITGSLGWALAPALLVPLAIAFSWRTALAAAGTLAFAVLAVLWLNRDRLTLPPAAPAAPAKTSGQRVEGNFDFLRIRAVWMCFGFFFFYAVVLSVIQAFAPEAARQLHGVPVALAALCLTVYMVCSAGGMVLGVSWPPIPSAASAWLRSASASPRWWRWQSGSRRCRRWWCRRCSARWGLPPASPGRRATCWSSAPAPRTPRVGSTALSTPGSTSGRRLRRCCSAR